MLDGAAYLQYRHTLEVRSTEYIRQMYRSYGALPCPFQRFSKNHPCCFPGRGHRQKPSPPTFPEPLGCLGALHHHPEPTIWTPRRAVQDGVDEVPQNSPRFARSVMDHGLLQCHCVSISRTRAVPQSHQLHFHKYLQPKTAALAHSSPGHYTSFRSQCADFQVNSVRSVP